MKSTLIAMLLIANSAFASEIDSFTNRDAKLKDSSERLNVAVAELLDKALTYANKKGTCSKKRLFKGLKKNLVGDVIAGPVERIVNNKKDPLIDSRRVKRKDSVYRDFNFFEAPVMLLFKSAMGAVVAVDIDKEKDNENERIYVGADKLGHFFTEGYHYYKKAVEQKKGLESALKWGIRTENLKFGKLTTAVFSWGDLAANYNGFTFWSNVLEKKTDAPGPYIKCVDGNFRQVLAFDWRYYIDTAWDEGINCSDFKNEKVEEKFNYRLDQLMEKTGRDFTCPMSTTSCSSLTKKYSKYSKLLLSPKLRPYCQ